MPEHNMFSPEHNGAHHITGPQRTYTGVSRDSRHTRKGDVFYCLSDTSYIDSAIANGADAIVIAEHIDAPSGLPAHIAIYQAMGDIRESLAAAAAACYPSPSLQHACAVTGTNGKTSVAHIYRSLMAAVQTPALSIGTLGMIPEGAHDAVPLDFGLTTPDPVTLHNALHTFTEHKGVRALCIEASSHGLDQRRCDGLRFDAAIFTNLTEDHLDYHKTKAAYLEAKRRIFALTHPGGLAIINADMPECDTLIQDAKAHNLRPLTVGYAANADWRITPDDNGFTLTIDGATQPIALSLGGDFQRYNACFALAAACDAFPEKKDAFIAALATMPEVPGRMQRVGGNALPAVYVDFAHTPDALINAARSLKSRISGRLVIVVGCGGDRDAEKRPLMGKAAAMYSDRVIITDDNPRTEDPATIRAAVMQGCPDAENISPRDAAIAAAVINAHPEDTILIAGKGHEDYQIIGATKTPFSDSEVVLKLLENC